MELFRYGIINENENQHIFAFGSHQYALYYWTKAVWERKLIPPSLLIHIDHHADFLTPKCAFDRLVAPKEIETNIKKGQLSCDTFIRPAISMGIIHDIAFCCYPCPKNDVPNFTNYESPIGIVDRLQSYLQSAHLCDKDSQLCGNIVSRNLILDIDLDFFLEPDEKGYLIPKNQSVVRNEIAAINELQKYSSITTIATSPNIGNNQKGYQQSIRETFCEHFAAKIDLSRQPITEAIGHF